jgi:hypothetical protein
MGTLTQKDQKFGTKWDKFVRCSSKQTHESKEKTITIPYNKAYWRGGGHRSKEVILIYVLDRLFYFIRIV